MQCPLYREFTEKLPNSVWSSQMWEWLLETGADWCLSLQDDVEVSPYFWGALGAMLEVLETSGATVCGLSSVHPIQVELARQGHRWYRTRSHLVGWAYAIRREALGEFMYWRAAHKAIAQTMTEDSLLNHWITVSGHDTWHPIPTIVDHDTTIDSSYANDTHVHRRPWITWRDFTAGSLTDPAFWRPNGPVESVPLLPTPAPKMCWACLERPAKVGAGLVMLCQSCVAQAAGILITRGAI
jgi:hypothetical protein